MDKKTNNNGNKMKGFGFYAIIIILLVITVSVLMQQSGTTSVTYAQVVDAFEQEKVIAAAMHDKKAEGDKIVTVRLEDIGSFSFEAASEEQLMKDYLEVFG